MNLTVSLTSKMLLHVVTHMVIDFNVKIRGSRKFWKVYRDILIGIMTYDVKTYRPLTTSIVWIKYLSHTAVNSRQEYDNNFYSSLPLSVKTLINITNTLKPFETAIKNDLSDLLFEEKLRMWSEIWNIIWNIQSYRSSENNIIYRIFIYRKEISTKRK